MNKKLCIAGHSGFIGSYIVPKFENEGFEIVKIMKSDIMEENIEKIIDAVNGSHVVINLSGVSINRRWSKKNRELIRNSRIRSTEIIVHAIEKAVYRPEVFINASGIDIYPQSKVCEENCTMRNHSFLADLISDWENSCEPLNQLSIRTVLVRLGVVFGKDGGIFKVFNESIKRFVGIVFGNGMQHISVVHINDLFNALNFIIKTNFLSGAINIVAPNTCRQIDIVKRICEKYNKKRIISINKNLVKLFFGERSSLLLDDRMVFPFKLVEMGFKFQFDNIKDMIDDLIGQ